MSKKRLSVKSKVVTHRNKYSIEQRKNARKYYIMGLNLMEISKLLDGCPVRTIEKWQQSEEWTDLKHPKNIKLKALELSMAGKTYNEIGDLLKISRASVWRYIKDAKSSNV